MRSQNRNIDWLKYLFALVVSCHHRLRPSIIDGRRKARRLQIGAIAALGLLAQLNDVLDFVVHIADRCHAEAERLRQSGRIGLVRMDVNVDQAWEERVAGLGKNWAVEVDGRRGDLGNLSVGDKDVARGDRALAIEDADVCE